MPEDNDESVTLPKNPYNKKILDSTSSLRLVILILPIILFVTSIMLVIAFIVFNKDSETKISSNEVETPATTPDRDSVDIASEEEVTTPVADRGTEGRDRSNEVETPVTTPDRDSVDIVTIDNSQKLLSSCGRLTYREYTHYLSTKAQYNTMYCFVEKMSTCEPSVLPLTVSPSHTYNHESNAYIIIEGSVGNECLVTIHGQYQDIIRNCGMSCVLYGAFEDMDDEAMFLSNTTMSNSCTYQTSLLNKIATTAKEDDLLLQLIQFLTVSSLAGDFTNNQNEEMDLQCKARKNYKVPTYISPQGVRSDYTPVPYSQIINANSYQSCGTINITEDDKLPAEADEIFSCFFESMETCNSRKMTMALPTKDDQIDRFHIFVEGSKFGGCEIGISDPTEDFNISCIFPQEIITQLLNEKTISSENEIPKVLDFIFTSIDSGEFDDPNNKDVNRNIIDLTCFDR